MAIDLETGLPSLTGFQRMQTYKQREVLYSGRDEARTHTMTLAYCEDLASVPVWAGCTARPGRPDTFFRNMIYEDEKLFIVFGR